MNVETLVAARALVASCPRWSPETGWRLPLVDGTTLPLDLDEAVLTRQVDRLLQRVVDENREALRAAALCDDRGRLLAVAWSAVAEARRRGWADGDYTVRLRGGHEVRFWVTEWDQTLLRRYEELLGRVARALAQEEVA